MEYSNESIEIKLNGPLERDPEQEEKETLGRVEEDRKYYVHVRIVNIMKNRKTMKHTALIRAVSSNLINLFLLTLLGLLNKYKLMTICYFRFFLSQKRTLFRPSA